MVRSQPPPSRALRGTRCPRPSAATERIFPRRRSGQKKKLPHRHKYLSGPRILPKGLKGREKAADLVDSTFLAYNAARLREGCRLFTDRMLQSDVTIGMSLSGALTPAGLGCSSIVPLMKAGFVDWIVSTGAILYHDLHFALNYPVRAGSFKFDDTELRGVVGEERGVDEVGRLLAALEPLRQDARAGEVLVPVGQPSS